MSRNQWSRRRAVNQPSKGKTARYNLDNERSAQLRLEAREQHPKFMISWARRFTRRRAAESGVDTNDHDSGEVDRTSHRQQASGQLPLNLEDVSQETARS